MKLLHNLHFSNFGSLKSTETDAVGDGDGDAVDFSNFGSLKSTETGMGDARNSCCLEFQQFRLVEEH